jgi:hypothetical protein
MVWQTIAPNLIMVGQNEQSAKSDDLIEKTEILEERILSLEERILSLETQNGILLQKILEFVSGKKEGQSWL